MSAAEQRAKGTCLLRTGSAGGTPLAVTDAAGLDAHLAALGVGHGMNLAVHSRLLSFGRIDDGAAGVYQALRRAVGPEATIAVPTYTLNLDAGEVFDPARTPSHNVGAFAEHVRSLADARRGRCPLHSHAAVGPAADAVAEAPMDRSFGPGSAFARMRKAEFTLLLLGCSFHDGATYVHQVEAEIGVPYRHWIELSRRVVMPDGEPHEIAFSYYARRPDAGVETDLHALQARLVSEPAIATADAPYGASALVPLAVLQDLVARCLAADPYCLVKPVDR